MRVSIHNQQRKADALIKALESAGHTVTNEFPLDLALLDHDGTPYYQSLIYQCQAHGVPVGLYTHGAMSQISWDGIWKAHPAVDFYLAQSPVEKRIMESYGYPHPIYEIGWHYCPLLPTQARPGKQVLYAPIHVLGNGFIPDFAKDANTRTFERLLQEDVTLTVYHSGNLETLGLRYVSGVEYLVSTGVNRTDLFQEYDCVVSYGTFAYLAVASGVPTYMYLQDVPPWDGHSAETVKYPAHYGAYKALMDYPYDLDDELRFMNWNKPQELSHWKIQNLGKPFNPSAFVELIKALC